MSLSLEMLQWLQTHLKPLINHPVPPFFLLSGSSLLLILWLKGVCANKKFRLPPSPLSLPIIGHLHYLGEFPPRSLQSLSRKYGPLMLLQMGFTPTLVVSSAEMAKELMKTHDIVFSNRPAFKASREYLYGGKDIIFGPYSEYWRQMRKVCAMDLFSVKRVQSFRYVRDEETSIMVRKIKESHLLMKDVNLSELILGVTNNIISRITAGGSLERKGAAKLIQTVVEQFGAFCVEDLFPSFGWVDALTGLTRKMKENSKAVHILLDEVIEEHLMSKEKNVHSDTKDLVDILLEYETKQSLGVEFTRENVRSIILDMFAAGTDTTYVTLEWAMAELVTHPDEMNKVQKEVRNVVGGKANVDEDDIHNMVYLNCVIKETLRMHPPVPLSVPRESTESANIEGYHIPAKTKVLVNLWAISRDPRYWDRPDEFIPERFINSSVNFKGMDFEFIPFGAGRRGCPGLTFGIVSAESILANLLYWFDWELVGGKKHKNLDMTEAFGLTVRLKTPLQLVPISHFPE